MKTKVKVDRQQLIEAIEARKEEARVEHEAHATAYPARLEDYRAAVTKTLTEALEALEKGKLVWEGYGRRNSRTHFKLELPSAPDKPSGKFDGSRYDRDIKLLSMSNEPTISLNADDFARYVR